MLTDAVSQFSLGNNSASENIHLQQEIMLIKPYLYAGSGYITLNCVATFLRAFLCH